MVIIDDAGDGCVIGIPIIAGYRAETGEKTVEYYGGISNCDLGINILKTLKVDKDELIFVCRGHIFKRFREYLKEEGYSFSTGEVIGEAQDIIEETFMEQLYSLGLSRGVTLDGKDYAKLNREIIDQFFVCPELMNHIRANHRKNKLITEISHKISRLEEEFPNLWKELLK